MHGALYGLLRYNVSDAIGILMSEESLIALLLEHID